MSYDVNGYLSKFKETRPKKGEGSHPVEQKDFQNISKYQHQPLEDLLGHLVSEGEIQAFNKDTDKSGYTLPFKKYVGPGNSVNLGEPNDKVDAVAQKHDLQYFDAQYRYDTGEISKAEAERQIAKSDKVAIAEFASEGGVSGYIGAGGLTVKHLVEKVTGQIYPNFSDNNSISGK